MTFTWHGEQLGYFDAPYNTTILNERAVEIPIALRFLAEQEGAGLEVGNVLGHYGVTGHRVVDLYEQADGVENIDVFDITGSYDWCVAISTLEHVDDPVGAVAHLRGLARPLLVTAPLGYNPIFDTAIKAGSLEPVRDCVLIRHGSGWVQRTRRTWRPYGATTAWADAVWIGEW